MGIVVGLTVKCELLDDSVRLPVKFDPVTVNVIFLEFPINTVPKLNEVGLTVIAGGGFTAVPERLTLTSLAPEALRRICPVIFPALVGVQVTITAPPVAGKVFLSRVNSVLAPEFNRVNEILPLILVPVTVNNSFLEFPTVTLPKFNDVGSVVMIGCSQVPDRLTVLLSPSPLTVIVPECVPTAVGL